MYREGFAVVKYPVNRFAVHYTHSSAVNSGASLVEILIEGSSCVTRIGSLFTQNLSEFDIKFTFKADIKSTFKADIKFTSKLILSLLSKLILSLLSKLILSLLSKLILSLLQS
jgi:hypothetical protein